MSDNNNFQLSGWIFLDKPRGVSSAHCVKVIKKELNFKGKIGHAGTLDPMAEGMLPIAIGEATKTIDYVLSANKEYSFTVQFGVKTDTKDAEGKVVAITENIPTQIQIIDKIKNFIGEIKQTPPAYSAIKINGKRAYTLARNNLEVNIPKRQVVIFEFYLSLYDAKQKQATFFAKVSKGTYIRSLGEDLAESLGSLGHVVYLRRENVGNNKEKILISLNSVYNRKDLLYENLVSLEDMLDDILAFPLSLQQAQSLLNGNLKGLLPVMIKDERVLATYNNKVVALLSNKEGALRILRVFNNQRNICFKERSDVTT